MRRPLAGLILLGASTAACSVPVSLPFGSVALPTPVPEPLVVSGALAVNECFPVSSISGRLVTVSGVPAAYPSGTKLLLHQVQQPLSPPTSCPSPVPSPTPLQDADLGLVGAFEEVQLASLEGSSIELVSAPKTAFDVSGRVQLCSFPAFTTVTVPAGAQIRTQTEWDPATRFGGLLAFRALEAVVLDGTIVAARAGYRGGAGSDNSIGGAALVDQYDCVVDGDDEGSFRGEGIDVLAAGYGRGNVGPAGGGGNARQAGGGGGAGRGAGGSGGRSDSEGVETEGVGGIGMAPSAPRLLFGGGGGAGHSVSAEGGFGGDGGGAVYIVAPMISGDGSISAYGRAGENDVVAGTGGGGGGGTVMLDVADTSGLADVSILVIGGDGGRITDAQCLGPGGGGGGGTVWLRSPAPAQVMLAGGGTTANPNCPTNLAQPGEDGILLLLP